MALISFMSFHYIDRADSVLSVAVERKKMAFVITQPCIGTKDTACVVVCPVDCIHPTKEEASFAAAEMLYIDPGTCIDCGLCVDECPVKAIFQDVDGSAESASFMETSAG